MKTLESVCAIRFWDWDSFTSFQYYFSKQIKFFMKDNVRSYNEKKMRTMLYSGIFSILCLFSSCSNDDNHNAPAVFEISASIDGREVGYVQTPNETNLVNNNYLENVRELRLVVFRNGTDDKEGYWSIRITGVDLDNIEVPYTLKSKQGYISWEDTGVKEFNEPTCSRLDVICLYGGESGDGPEINILDITNNQIRGAFSGRLNRFTVGPSVVEDPNDFVQVTQGRFAIEYTRNNTSTQ